MAVDFFFLDLHMSYFNRKKILFLGVRLDIAAHFVKEYKKQRNMD